MKKITKIHRRRRREGEIATPRTAIRNMCLECTGYDSAEVRRCGANECWLFPYRLGATGIDSQCCRRHQAAHTATESTKQAN